MPHGVDRHSDPFNLQVIVSSGECAGVGHCKVELDITSCKELFAVVLRDRSITVFDEDETNAPLDL